MGNPEEFACEQIRGLVRRVFFAHGSPTVKQVAFVATEPTIDVAAVCEQVARTLSFETHSQVALVDGFAYPEAALSLRPRSKKFASLQAASSRLTANLWKVGRENFPESNGDETTGLHWLARVAEVRSQFEYAVIAGPVAGISSHAALLGQITDGLILLLGANTTRRATARKIKETLEASQARILGTVLCDRTFPIPETLYRWL